MNTLPDSVVQHLSGFLHRSDGKSLACTAKRYRINLDKAFFIFLVWRESVPGQGACCCESPKVWSVCTKLLLLEHYKKDVQVVKISITSNTSTRYYKPTGWVDKHNHYYPDRVWNLYE